MIMNRIIKKLFISLFLVASTGICFAESYKANLIRGWPDAVLSESQVQDYADDTCLLKDGSNADTTIDIGSEDLTTIGTITADTFTDSTLVITGGVITNATNTNWDLAYAHIAESGASHTYINQDVTSASSPTFDGTNFTGIPNGALDETYINADGTVPLSGDWAWGANNISGTGNLTTTGTGTFAGIQDNGTLTVGQDTTGYDLKCYGATTGRYLQWQSDTDTLKVIGGTGSVATGTEAVNLEGPVDVNGSITLDKTTIYGPTQSYSTFSQGTVIIAADDITPDVSGGNIFTTSANTQATAITDLDNPTVGQIVYIVGGSNTDSSTIADGGSFNLSAAWTASLDDVLVLFVQADNDYIEISRSNN